MKKREMKQNHRKGTKRNERREQDKGDREERHEEGGIEKSKLIGRREGEKH